MSLNRSFIGNLSLVIGMILVVLTILLGYSDIQYNYVISVVIADLFICSYFYFKQNKSVLFLILLFIAILVGFILLTVALVYLDVLTRYNF